MHDSKLCRIDTSRFGAISREADARRKFRRDFLPLKLCREFRAPEFARRQRTVSPLNRQQSLQYFYLLKPNLKRTIRLLPNSKPEFPAESPAPARFSAIRSA